MKKFVILLLSLIAFTNVVWAESDTEHLRKHVIVVIDGESSIDLSSSSVRDDVIQRLFGDNGLVNDGDKLSVICAKANCPKLEKDGKTVKIKSDPIVNACLRWDSCDTISNIKRKIDENWSGYVKKDWFTYKAKHYSLLSISKSYAVDVLKQTGDEIDYVDQTYILYITDDLYNGNNYYGESLYYLYNIITADDSIFYGQLNGLMSICADVASQYGFKYVPGRRVKCGWRYLYYDLFELVPNQQSLNLPTVLSYPPVISAKRQSQGRYVFDFEINARNEEFDVLSVDVYGYRNGVKEKIYGRGCLELGENDNVRGEFHVSSPYDSLSLEGVVHINETVYGATRLSPKTIPGLAQNIKVVMEPDAEVFFNLFRLPDCIWLPWCDTQYEVALMVNIFLLLLVIIIFVVYVLWRRTYTPTDKDITIGFYDKNNKK